VRITWDNIDWVYINLDHRPDRRAHAEAEFARHGIVPKRQQALYVTKDNCRPSPLTERMYKRTPGAIGCWLSELTAIKNAAPDRILAVCEDDVVFCDDLRQRIEYLGQHVPDNWDVVWLQATCHTNPAHWHKDDLGRDADRIGHRLFRAYGMFATHAYMVNPASRGKICEMLDEHMADCDGIDDCFIKFIEPQLWTYFMVPGCAAQYDNYGDVGNGLTRFSEFKREIPYVFAARMEDFDPAWYDWREAAGDY
jgi:GR25 family glycosyltransferase involved in LPS biosynthesis